MSCNSYINKKLIDYGKYCADMVFAFKPFKIRELNTAEKEVYTKSLIINDVEELNKRKRAVIKKELLNNPGLSLSDLQKLGLIEIGSEYPLNRLDDRINEYLDIVLNTENKKSLSKADIFKIKDMNQDTVWSILNIINHPTDIFHFDIKHINAALKIFLFKYDKETIKKELPSEYHRFLSNVCNEERKNTRHVKVGPVADGKFICHPIYGYETNMFLKNVNWDNLNGFTKYIQKEIYNPDRDISFIQDLFKRYQNSTLDLLGLFYYLLPLYPKEYIWLVENIKTTTIENHKIFTEYGCVLTKESVANGFDNKYDFIEMPFRGKLLRKAINRDEKILDNRVISHHKLTDMTNVVGFKELLKSRLKLLNHYNSFRTNRGYLNRSVKRKGGANHKKLVFYDFSVILPSMTLWEVVQIFGYITNKNYKIELRKELSERLTSTPEDTTIFDYFE